jgi:beta-N-acetylhexosaminidase
VSSIIPTLICDVQGLTLNPIDKDLLRHPATAGVILFTRNYGNPKQLLTLTRSILKENSRLFITVDQEGGRVQRFKEGFSILPSMGYWGEQYKLDSNATAKQLTKTVIAMARELKTFHIALDYVPVLDLNYHHNEVIGERSFSRDPMIVAQLGKAFINGLHQERMCSVGKHFPGHGFVYADSHQTLPIDKRDKKNIENNDLIPFSNLVDSLDAIMPAHIVYSQIDSVPTCFSKVWLQDILRERLKFQGVVITDDLNMSAVRSRYSIEDSLHHALNAGCDFLLMCNNQTSAAAMLHCLEMPSTYTEKRKVRVNQFINKVQRCIA